MMPTIKSFISSHRLGSRPFSIYPNCANSVDPSIVNEPTSNLRNEIVPRIGLEVHAQLNIKSKLFSQGGNSSQASSNSQLDLFDIALPGTLPKLNNKALRAAILSALGLNCSIQKMIHFDRKNYFYSDMPAGYQITQYTNPIARTGYIDFIATTHHRSVIAHTERYDLVKYLFFEDRRKIEEFVPYLKRSHIKQVQLEQDSAKTLNQMTSADSQNELYNLIDYNRSGAALIEIVFEPDLTNHQEAASLIKELIYVLKALKTCDCELQQGSLRVDANVSIRSIAGQEVKKSQRVELKNLNSLKSLNKGILYEIQRQAALIKAGETVVQETRTYDTRSDETVPLRIKEESVDYRYVPEPSIPPLRIDQETIDQVKRELPSCMPSDIRDRLMTEYNLDLSLVAEIMAEPGLSNFMEEIIKERANYDANIVADFLIYTVVNLKNIVGAPMEVDFEADSEFLKRLSPERMRTLFDMMLQDEISFSIAYEVIKLIFLSNNQSDPREIVNDHGWYQINDETTVETLCLELIGKMKNISKQYKKKGQKKHLRLMLIKLCELTDDKISVKRSIDCLERLLKPAKDDK